MNKVRGIFVLIFVCIGYQPVHAQNSALLSPHWGAITHPTTFESVSVAADFNRFTVLGKPTDDQGDVPYNEIKTSAGFNMMNLEWNHLLHSVSAEDYGLSFEFFLTIQAGFGITTENPTKYVQNDVIHDFLDIPHVPVDTARTSRELSSTVNFTSWIGKTSAKHIYWGLGVASSSVFSEYYGFAGVRDFRIELFKRAGLDLSASVRSGLSVGGDAFPTATIASNFNLFQFSVAIPFNELHSIIPRVEGAYSFHSGIFVDSNLESIGERLGALRIEWRTRPVRFGIETWNDIVGGKDKGPTGGGRAYFQFSIDYFRQFIDE